MAYRTAPKMIYSNDVVLLVSLKHDVDKGPIFFFLFLKENSFSNILNKKIKKIMRNNKVENEL